MSQIPFSNKIIKPEENESNLFEEKITRRQQKKVSFFIAQANNESLSNEQSLKIVSYYKKNYFKSMKDMKQINDVPQDNLSKQDKKNFINECEQNSQNLNEFREQLKMKNSKLYQSFLGWVSIFEKRENICEETINQLIKKNENLIEDEQQSHEQLNHNEKKSYVSQNEYQDDMSEDDENTKNCLNYFNYHDDFYNLENQILFLQTSNLKCCNKKECMDELKLFQQKYKFLQEQIDMELEQINSSYQSNRFSKIIPTNNLNSCNNQLETIINKVKKNVSDLFDQIKSKQ